MSSKDSIWREPPLLPVPLPPELEGLDQKGKCGPEMESVLSEVHANRVRVIDWHLYIKSRTFDRAKKSHLCNPRVYVKRVRVNEVLL